MDLTRKTSSPAPPVDSDQEDWDLEILQAMVSPSTAEDAALACAAAWMNFVHAERVAVAVFDSTTSCIVAHGQRDGSHLTIYVGRETASVACLLRPDRLFGPGGPCTIENPSQVLCWPEHLSAVLVNVDEDIIEEERIDLIQDLSRKLLSRWTTPVTSFANPEHMEAMAEFAAGAGHEINNPLGSIIGQTQLLLKREDRSEYRQALETIGAQAWRIRDMIGDTMLFARPPQPEFRHCELIPLAKKIVADLNVSFAGKAQWIQLEASPTGVAAFADEAQIATLLAHLIRNACEAVADLDEGQKIVVQITRQSDFAANITVTDNGPQIRPEVRRHLFDPFYSGRQAGRGLGFGLCHCWQIVRMHNGILTQESLDSGNRFTAILPVEAG
ncbi:MAG: HAMP domain-containing sensor histidine kinase [Planctomycetaceae bacterium]